MNVHPLAELIPAMTDAEYAELLADMKANGQLEPITLYEGKILDGRHRARVCDELGIEPATRAYDGDSPAAYVLSLNVKRRSLSVSQRAALAVEFLPQLEEEARRRQGHGTTAPGRSGSTEPKRSDSGHRAREQAGELVGVSGASVDRAKRVKRDAPDLYEKVKQGKVSVREADASLGKPAAKPNGRAAPTYDFTQGRGRTVAEANREKLHGVCSALEGYAEGLDNFKYERALALASDEDKASWLRSIAMTLRALRGAKKAIEGSTQ